jgi:hypothetical protein
VVVTGNHWWLDGIVAVAILAVCAWAVFGVSTAWRRTRSHWSPDHRPPTARPALAEAVLRG